MKTLALTLILALHATGLWPHLSESTRTNLTSRAAEVAPAVAAVPAAAPDVPLPSLIAAPPPALQATSAVAIDRTTGTVLYSKNPGEHRPVASITKMVTALTILSRHEPDDKVTIPKLPDYPDEAETMGLVEGDTFKIIELIEAALVPSANDAADALAIIDSGSVAKFTPVMNTYLAGWGIKDVHFTSASGLEEYDNYASATALSQIAGLALANPHIARTAGYANVSITSGQKRTYTLSTTNKLLASGNFYGIKTGYTLAAGECFVGLTRINGHEVITVVLGSTNRFGDTQTLANWIEDNWKWL